MGFEVKKANAKFGCEIQNTVTNDCKQQKFVTTTKVNKLTFTIDTRVQHNQQLQKVEEFSEYGCDGLWVLQRWEELHPQTIVTANKDFLQKRNSLITAPFYLWNNKHTWKGRVDAFCIPR